jgi:flavin reductase ActVB
MTAVPEAPATVVDAFKAAMAGFPSGVTLVTTATPNGRWWGFTATAVCSVSVDPPLVLVCLAKSAECAPVFAEAPGWTIQILRPEHAKLAFRFATRGADKFGGGEFEPGNRGTPVLADACAVLECEAFDHHDGGDHTILVGRVLSVPVEGGPAAVFYRRNFHQMAAVAAT